MELVLLNTRMQRSLIARLLDIAFSELEVITSNTVMNFGEQQLGLATEVVGTWSPSFGLRPQEEMYKPLTTVAEAVWEFGITPACKLEGGCFVVRTRDVCNDKTEWHYQMLPMEVYADYVTWLGDMSDAA